VPQGARPERLVIELTKIDATYMVRLDRDDVLLLGAEEPLFPSVFRGALVLALHASVFAAVALFCAARFGWGTSLLVAAGLLVVATSFEVLGTSMLAGLPPGLSSAVLGILRTLLPDYDSYDAGERLSRGTSIGWGLPAGLLIRLAVTGLALGLADGLADERRRR